MAFTFENIGNNIFLVYGLCPEDTLDTMTLGMITKNNIPGLVPALYTQVNQDCFLKYNVTSKITMRKFFAGVVNRRRLLGVFSSIVSALSAAEEYMLDLSSLLLDVDYIYVDVASCRAEVICLPLENCAERFIVNGRERANADIFFKRIMFTTQFDETENCDYVAAIMNYLNRAASFVAEDFGGLIEELQREPPASQPQVRTVEIGTQGQYGRGRAQGTSIGDQYPGLSTEGQFKGGTSGVQNQSQPTGRQFKGGPVGGQSPGRLMEGQNQESAVGGQAGDRSQGKSSAGGAGPQTCSPNMQHRPFSGTKSQGQPVNGQFQVPPSGEQASQVSKEKRSRSFQKNKGEESFSQASGQAGGEKSISMFYLLQHYNKENAAAYKAQKNAEKEAKKGAKDSTKTTDKARRKKEKLGVKTGPGFAVPGQGNAVTQSPVQGGQVSQPPIQSQGVQFSQPPIQSQGVQFSQLSMPLQGRQFSQQYMQSQGGQSSQQSVQFQEVQFSPQQEQSIGENFGDTVIMEEDYGDTVLWDGGQDVALRPYLLRCSNNEKILLEKDIFRIGKERSYVDYCIGNNPTISRSHADILRKNGRFYIVDNNSTNHTYINGKMIPSNVEVALVHGTKISLSNEEFEFMTF